MATATSGRRGFLTGFTALAGTSLIVPRWVAAAEGCLPTSSDDVGPFYIEGAPLRTELAPRDEPGDALLVRGRIVGADCSSPLAGAYLGVWQADTQGRYHGKSEGFRLRGVMKSGASGEFAFSTIVPGRYKTDATHYRPAHIHFIVFHPSHQTLISQLYIAGDPYLGDKDGCGPECDSKDPGRHLTLARPEGGPRFETEAKIVLAARRT